MAAALRTAVGKLTPKSSVLMLCDIQDRFRPLIHEGESIVSQANFLCRIGSELDVPVVCTEQYVKAFGHTCADVLNVPATDGTSAGQMTVPTFEKKLFSMCTPEVMSHISSLGDRTSFILFGIEAHVCVQQTALDLLEQGFDVHVVVDGVSSMSPLDREVALNRMEKCGAYLTTAQSAAFMLMQSAEHPNFKTVSKMISTHAAVNNGFHEIARKRSNL
ncbi:hypothetical protein TrCOL_g2687 [Triparma columacea]|uniref:Isochorismatase-like domain-containing protein n=1 Tax=Triparma columacea TaxID=722753 RepID=A0A9W7GFY3_9STRA|nr:hypothetical protein TrCOL_g2687 [Triparma columacea]